VTWQHTRNETLPDPTLSFTMAAAAAGAASLANQTSLIIRV